MNVIPIDTIVVPQGAEYQAVCRGLKQAQAKNIRAIAIPIGTRNIQQTLISYPLELSNAQNIVIMGLCGSLNKLYTVSDAILYTGCMNLDRQQVNLEPELTTSIQQKISVNLVTGLTSDRVINTVTEKLQLNQTYSVDAIDMEGYNYIQELQQRGLNVAMLRIVSDDVAGNIPDLSVAIDREGNLKTIPLAIAILKQPIAAIRLIKGSLRGLKRLEQITFQLVK